MFLQPQTTPYDVVFSFFGIPIRINPFFWLVAVLFGWDWVQLGFDFLALFVLCFFVSIFVHELGHAFAYRFFRFDSAIWLYGFGGLAMADGRPRAPINRIIISLAGPAAGFALFGIVVGTNQATEWSEKSLHLAAVFSFLYFMNLWWNVLNLLPIFPLDGGQVSRELFQQMSPNDGVKQSLVLSIVLAIALCVHGLMGANGKPLIPYLPSGGYFMAFLFGLLAFENFQMLQSLRGQDRHWGDGPSWR